MAYPQIDRALFKLAHFGMVFGFHIDRHVYNTYITHYASQLRHALDCESVHLSFAYAWNDLCSSLRLSPLLDVLEFQQPSSPIIAVVTMDSLHFYTLGSSCHGIFHPPICSLSIQRTGWSGSLSSGAGCLGETMPEVSFGKKMRSWGLRLSITSQDAGIPTFTDSLFSFGMFTRVSGFNTH